MAEKGQMTVREAGRRGGRATKERHGPEFYQSIGHAGGTKTMERHGRPFYEKIGRMGGQVVSRLVRRARELEAEKKKKK